MTLDWHQPILRLTLRTSVKKLNPSLKRQLIKTLAQVMGDIKNSTEMDKFLSDFLTESEYEMLAKRLAVAYYLKKGRSYSNIKNNLIVSSATVAAIQTEMKKNGFQTALKHIEAEEWANQWSEKIKKFIK